MVTSGSSPDVLNCGEPFTTESQETIDQPAGVAQCSPCRRSTLQAPLGPFKHCDQRKTAPAASPTMPNRMGASRGVVEVDLSVEGL